VYISEPHNGWVYIVERSRVGRPMPSLLRIVNRHAHARLFDDGEH